MIKYGRPVPGDVETRLPQLVKALARDERIEALWLFGSRARNEAYLDRYDRDLFRQAATGSLR
jgi:predicted nucleotidyltransferase